MSQDFHQQIFSFSHGVERSSVTQQDQHHQIRRNNARVQEFEAAPPPLVGTEEEEAVYETTGMLSEMFNCPPGGAKAVELLDRPTSANYRSARPPPSAAGIGQVWYGNRHGLVSGFGAAAEAKNRRGIISQQYHQQIPAMNVDSATAMQLFLMNPQTSSPSPSPHHNHSTPTPATSTLHMLLPNPSSTSLQGFTGTAATAGVGALENFTWVPDSNTTPPQLNNTAIEIGRVVEGQALSLSLSSSLQRFGSAKAHEEMRTGDGGFLYYNQGHGTSSNLGNHNLQALDLQPHAVFGSSSSSSAVNVLTNSKYLKATQELLEEICSVGRSQFKNHKVKLVRQPSNLNSNPGSSSSSKDVPLLSASDRIEHHRRKVKLLAMLDEVDRRYNHYCEQMQMVVNSFDMAMGFGAAVPYTVLAQKAMSRHFRCLKDAITDQLKHNCEVLGEKDRGGSSGVTKGETPRLKLLDQSLRQQRAFNQVGMVEQEVWRPQRGLAERSVTILRAWLFEHFLNPYPSDADKHLLARQTGLSRNQVSNWFINARVRLWKPMVEEMYQQEAKDEVLCTDEDAQKNQRDDNGSSGFAQTPTLSTATTQPLPSTTAAASTGKRSETINASESDPSSLVAIKSQGFSGNQARKVNSDMQTTVSAVSGGDMGSTLIRHGTTPGNVSLTLGLRHAGNASDKSSAFSIRDFGEI